ncbi:hypothetical protein DL546_000206, partial [Coniochaeta pulveracea]
MGFRDSGGYVSLAEHFAYRPEQEVYQVPKRPDHRLTSSDLRMSRRPTTRALAETHMQWWQQTLQSPMEMDPDTATEPAYSTWDPESEFSLRFDEAYNQRGDVVEPSSSPVQASGHKPNLSPNLEDTLRLGIKPDGSLIQKSSPVWGIQQSLLVPQPVLNLNPSSTKDPVVAASHAENGNRPDSAMSRLLLEKRQNRLSVSELRLRARPEGVLDTTLELGQELQLLKSQGLRPHARAPEHQNS